MNFRDAVATPGTSVGQSMEEVDLADRIATVEHELRSIRRALIFLLKERGNRTVLLAELHRATYGGWFCSGPTYRTADDDLRRALNNCRIRSARGLTQWLMANEDFGIEFGGMHRDGLQFRISETDEE